MKKTIMSLFALILSCETIHAQCPPGDVILNTQQLVNEFAELYPNCIEIAGDLSIGTEGSSSDITDLTPLNKITTVQKRLIIYNNWILTSFADLENITTVGGHITIAVNDELLSLNGLENITTVNGNLTITRNPKLTNLSGLQNITSISEQFWLGTLIGINDLDDLPPIALVKRIWLENNDNLTDITGLDNVNFSGLNMLRFYGNDKLAICESVNVCNYLHDGGNASIYENAENCNTLEEVLEACQLIPTTGADVNNFFSLSPNPVNSQLHLQLGTSQPEMTINITSITGEVIYREVVDISGGATLVTFDIADYPAGVYFLSVNDGKELQVQRFVKS